MLHTLLQVVALYSEAQAGSSGGERMLARVRRFYRPQVGPRRYCAMLCLAVPRCDMPCCEAQLVCLSSHVLPVDPTLCCAPLPRLTFCLLQETPLGGLAPPGHLFRSDQIEDRLPLAAVVRKCSVVLLPAGQGATQQQQQAAAEGEGRYVCAAQLDLEIMMLGALPPDCLAGGGGG